MTPSTRTHTRRSRALAVAAVALASVLASCSGGVTAGGPTTTTTTTTTTEAPRATTTTIDPAAPPVVRHGQLSVCGTHLCDTTGEAIQLRGMSSHGLQWYRHCLTDASLDVLFDEWHADLLRTSMYVHEGGYLTDPAGYAQVVRDLVDEVVARDRYVVIDWHVLAPGDPMDDVDAAVDFFSGMAQRYADQPHVLYEIANEPNGVPWSRIKEYAERVIPAIRAHDDDAVILVGTPAWSSFGVSEGSSPAEVVADPLADDDVMYTFHFYAADFRESYLEALVQASAQLPVFVSEFGTQESTGGGADDFDMARRYLDHLDVARISWVAWNYSDNSLSGAAWQPGTCGNDGPWTADRLKPSGVWVRDQLLAGR